MANGRDAETSEEDMRGPLCAKQECDHGEQVAVVQANKPPADNTTNALIYSSLDRPLSDYSDDLNRTVAKRIKEWVNRPTEVRLREAQQPDGYVARPLNSFMLYRLAYIAVAEARYSQPKQQKLSAIIAKSWRKEHPEVHEKYKAYARTESRNHHEAYPKYRFSSKRLERKKPDKENTSPEEELRTISGDECSCDSCWFTAARSKNQAWGTTLCHIDTDVSTRSPAPSEFPTWQPILLPLQPILLPMQPTLWQNQYGNYAVHYQVVGSNNLWPSAMTPSLFLGPDRATWELQMGSMGFTTMLNTNSAPVADPLWSGAEMLADVGVNYQYAIPAHDPSYCGYPYTSSTTAPLP
jgi:hypothetical protein